MQTERESTRRLRTDAHLYDRPDRAHRDMVHFDAPSASRHVGARVLACCAAHVLCSKSVSILQLSHELLAPFSVLGTMCRSCAKTPVARSAHLSDLLPCVLLPFRACTVSDHNAESLLLDPRTISRVPDEGGHHQSSPGVIRRHQASSEAMRGHHESSLWGGRSMRPSTPTPSQRPLYLPRGRRRG
jgi:hypothetical protein